MTVPVTGALPFTPEEASSIAQEAKQAYDALVRDLPRLRFIQDYLMGKHNYPYMPDAATAEYHMLAQRSITNWLPLVVDATAQALFVDNFRPRVETIAGYTPGVEDEEFDPSEDEGSPYWMHWQGSHMDAKQATLFRSALEYGHAFVLTARDRFGKVRSRGISPMRCIAMFEDPMSDLEPTSALEVFSKPYREDDKVIPGVWHYWDDEYLWTLHWKDDGDKLPRVVSRESHGAERCPVTRLATHVDLDGNTRGLVEPLIPLQDRVNQTVFDLLVAQTYTSFEVRTVSGMAPPIRMKKNADGFLEPELDANGNPIPDRVLMNASRFLYAENSDVDFGHLPGGDLSGLISAVELAVRQMCAVAQVPPHYMLGQIANVNADGLRAAAEALQKKNMEVAAAFGEGIERMFRVFAEIEGIEQADDDFGEVVWRDLSNASQAQSADALGKYAQMLEIPKRGLWGMVPGVTRTQLNQWHKLFDEELRLGGDALNGLPNDFDPFEQEPWGVAGE